MARKIVANNKKARHDYFIEDVYEAGMVLTGTEIKSIRRGRVSIKESYAKIESGEVFIYGLNKMKRRRMPVMDGFFPRRSRIDGIEGDGHFDQFFLHAFHLSKITMPCLSKSSILYVTLTAPKSGGLVNGFCKYVIFLSSPFTKTIAKI